MHKFLRIFYQRSNMLKFIMSDIKLKVKGMQRHDQNEKNQYTESKTNVTQMIK